jgi:hypothetical protein
MDLKTCAESGPPGARSTSAFFSGSVPFFGGTSSGDGAYFPMNSMNSDTPTSFFADVTTDRG